METPENPQKQDHASEILMSILMASSQKPDGLPKSDIMDILAAYDEVELYELCEAAESVEMTLPDGLDDDETEALIESLNV